MSLAPVTRRVISGVLCAACLGVTTPPAHASVPPYTLVGSFSLPAGAWDIGPEGRLYRMSPGGTDIFLQDSVNGSAYSKVGSLVPGTVDSFGPTFLRVSPDGSRMAIGDGRFDASASVQVISVGSLSTVVPSVGFAVVSPNFDAAWDGNDTLYVTGARSTDFVPIVNRLSLAGVPTAQTVIDQIGLASGGVTVRGGTLYTACGFLPTGEIRSFSTAALTGPPPPLPVAFGSGTLIGFVLSGSPLGFDPFGNMLVGGGDSFSGTSDVGYAAVVDLADVAHPLKLSPAGTGTLYSTAFNAVTQELLVVDTNAGVAYRYAVPVPSSVAVVGLGVFAACGRRRRGDMHSPRRHGGHGEDLRSCGNDSRLPSTTLFLLALCSPCLRGETALAQSPFATQVIEYSPAPGQNVQQTALNNPAKALGAPVGGGLISPDNTKVVTLGGYGGTITLGFDRSVWANPHNPRGMDFIIYGNGFFVGSGTGDPKRRWAECGVVEVCRDDNHNGLADDAWYVIPGSHLPSGVPLNRTNKTWDESTLNPAWVPAGRSGMWSTSAYALTGPPFNAGPLLVNSDPVNESVWGYADTMPTLRLGDINADDVVDDPVADPLVFHTRPDDPLKVGVSPGSGGGAAMAIRWAVNPSTGQPAALDRIDFVRITTAVDYVSPLLGEVSTEIGAVADVRPLYAADWNLDGTVSVQDVFDFLGSWFGGTGENGGADFNNSGTTTVQDVFDFLTTWFAGR